MSRRGAPRHARPSCEYLLLVPDRSIGVLLFAGSLLVFSVVSRHKYVAYDAASMVWTNSFNRQSFFTRCGEGLR